MSEVSRGIDAFAEFKVFTSRSGVPTAMHLPTGNLIHSAVDPVREAADIVSSESATDGVQIVVVGGGLGYVPEQIVLMNTDTSVLVIEPDAALCEIANHCRPNAAYLSSPRIHTVRASTPKAMARSLDKVSESASVIVAPYLLRIACCGGHPLANIMRILRAETASRSVYNTLVTVNESRNRAILVTLPGAITAPPGSRPVLVAGAGPSLDLCVEAMRRFRPRFTLIAASGAVPALLKSEIVPDWTIALEAKESVVADVEGLPRGSNAVVFAATNSAVLKMDQLRLSSGIHPSGNLQTRGGSSVIPALDLALHGSRANVFIVGVDLGYQSGGYASGSHRSDAIDASRTDVPPKFLSMRSGLETVIESHGSRTITHVLASGLPLRGTRHVLPDQLSALLSAAMPSEVMNV
jgi:hypothetical protein